MAMPASEEKLVETIITRTRENLSMCQHIVENDVTFYLNSMIGLLVIPKEELYKDITDNIIDKKLLNEVKTCVAENYDTKLTEIVRHLRNSVTHGHISFDGEKPPLNSKPATITKIVFKDYEDRSKTNQTYEMTIDVNLFKRFVTEFSVAALKLAQEKEGDLK